MAALRILPLILIVVASLPQAVNAAETREVVKGYVATGGVLAPCEFAGQTFGSQVCFPLAGDEVSATVTIHDVLGGRTIAQSALIHWGLPIFFVGAFCDTRTFSNLQGWDEIRITLSPRDAVQPPVACSGALPATNGTVQAVFTLGAPLVAPAPPTDAIPFAAESPRCDLSLLFGEEQPVEECAASHAGEIGFAPVGCNTTRCRMRTSVAAVASMELPGGLQLSSRHVVAQGSSGICGAYAPAYSGPIACSWTSDVDVQVVAGQCASVAVNTQAATATLQTFVTFAAVAVSNFQVCRDASGTPTISAA